MAFRPVAIRLLVACLAILQGLAPGTASLLDARPAARAMAERAATHVEEPGTRHTFDHGQQCLLCGAATQRDATVGARQLLSPDAGVPSRPTRAAWRARDMREPASQFQSRAPPA